MKFFIKSVNPNEIKKAQNFGIVNGITTNPSLMAKENILGEGNIKQHCIEIREIVDGDVSTVVSLPIMTILSKREKPLPNCLNKSS